MLLNQNNRCLQRYGIDLGIDSYLLWLGKIFRMEKLNIGISSTGCDYILKTESHVEALIDDALSWMCQINIVFWPVKCWMVPKTSDRQIRETTVFTVKADIVALDLVAICGLHHWNRNWFELCDDLVSNRRQWVVTIRDVCVIYEAGPPKGLSRIEEQVSLSPLCQVLQ